LYFTILIVLVDYSIASDHSVRTEIRSELV
jgi:hypothetical protein